MMIRFYFWLRLHSLLMDIGNASRWIDQKLYAGISRAGRYCLQQARKHISDEFHPRLTEVEKENAKQEDKGELEYLRRVVQRVYMSAIPDLQCQGRSFISSEMVEELRKVQVEKERV